MHGISHQKRERCSRWYLCCSWHWRMPVKREDSQPGESLLDPMSSSHSPTTLGAFPPALSSGGLGKGNAAAVGFQYSSTKGYLARTCQVISGQCGAHGLWAAEFHLGSVSPGDRAARSSLPHSKLMSLASRTDGISDSQRLGLAAGKPTHSLLCTCLRLNQASCGDAHTDASLEKVWLGLF